MLLNILQVDALKLIRSRLEIIVITHLITQIHKNLPFTRNMRTRQLRYKC